LEEEEDERVVWFGFIVVLIGKGRVRGELRWV